MLKHIARNFFVPQAADKISYEMFLCLDFSYSGNELDSYSGQFIDKGIEENDKIFADIMSNKNISVVNH